MAPKKQKMSLNDFLADETLGSWADEMESLPTAPAFRPDDAPRNRGGDRGFGDRPDRGFPSDRDRTQFPPREDVPLPTEPPFTAFIGNLPFDLTEGEIEEHFGPHKVKTVKIITDKKDGKPKGFGYVEFEELAGLKDAMAKSGSSLAGRVIRVSVADPPKERERSGFGGGGGFDDEKYAGDWRRTGPLPALEERRGSRPGSSREEGGGGGGGFGFGSRFHDREAGPPSAAESAGDWRSSRPSPRLGTNLVPDPTTMKRRSSGFSTPTDGPSPADTEEVWTMGSKFKRSPPASVAGGAGAGPGGPRKFSAGRSDMGPPAAPADEGDWRSGPRRPGNAFERSPTNSTPPTPNMGRKKLELLPRSGGGSAVGSPMSSPKFASATPVAARANPFGAARPIDATAREKEVAEKMERKEKDLMMRRAPSSRPSSRAPSERAHSPPPGPQTPSSPAPTGARFTAATVRPAVSFASAAKAKAEGEAAKAKGDGVDDIASGVKEITV